MERPIIFEHALVRPPAPCLVNGLRRHDHGPPNYELALAQHEAYVQALRGAGLQVESLPPEPDYPDAPFIEDTAVVTPGLAIITRPGAPSRRGEEQAVAAHLGKIRPLAWIEAPGTLDGGDVLCVADHFFVGRSSRSNEEGVRQFTALVRNLGYRCTSVPVGDGLHLKSSVNVVAEDTLLMTADFAELECFRPFRRLIVPREEAYACNCLRVNGHLIVPRGYEQTLRLLEPLGCVLHPLDMSEMAKLDGGLTCLSLRY